MASLAASPIALILVLMLGLRMSAARAGVVGCVVAFSVAYLVFDYGTARVPLGVPLATLGVFAEALFATATILWIILPALCMHNLQLRTGQVEVLQRALMGLSGDPRVTALLVAWFFVLFVEGAAGFGTSVALAAPFLVAAGFGRVQAVVIALVGHAVGVSFGAVGTPIVPQVAATPYSAQELAAATGIYHAFVGWMIPLAMMALTTRALPESGAKGAGIWGWTLLAAALFLLPYTLLSRFVGPELPTLGGALFGGVAFVGVLRVRRSAARTPPGGVVCAGAPYLALVAAVLVTRLVPPLRVALTGLELSWGFGPFSGSVQPLYHPGTMLFIGFALGAALQRAPAQALRGAVSDALGQLLPVTVALTAMLALSRVMVHAGMIDELALAAANLAGPLWPLFAPFVGMLGTFVTGSATASNILFTDFQRATALALELPALPLLGAQGFGAAVGNIVCPHNVIAAGATVALVGREGEVLARTLWVGVLYALLGGLLALFVFT
jgi:lactate permease